MIYRYSEKQLASLEESIGFVRDFRDIEGDSSVVIDNEKKTLALNELSRINTRREELIKIVLSEPVPKPRHYSPFKEPMEYHESFAK